MSALSIFTAAAAPAAGGGFAAFMLNVVPLILMFAVFYFLMIRPQQRRMREHAARVASIARGNTVVTAGGLIGKVTKVTDDEVEVEVAANTRVRVVKATISEVRSPVAKPAND